MTLSFATVTVAGAPAPTASVSTVPSGHGVVLPSGIRYDLMTPAERARKPADLVIRNRRQPR